MTDAIFGLQVPVLADVWLPWLATAKEWLLRDGATQSLYQRLYVLQHIYILRPQFLHWHGASIEGVSRLPFMKEAVACCRASWKFHEEFAEVEPSLFGSVQILNVKNSYAYSIVILTTSPGAVADGCVNDSLFAEAAKAWKECREEYKARGNLEFQLRVATALGNLYWSWHKNLGTVEEPDCLPYFEDCLEIYSELRRQTAILNPSRAFVAKGNQARNLQIEGIARVAIETSLHIWAVFQDANLVAPLDSIADQTNLMNMARIGHWSQRRKARSLTELLGLSGNIPSSIMASISQHPAAIELLKQEDVLAKDISVAILSRKAGLRAQLKELQAKMRETQPILRPVLDMRAGTTMSLAETEVFGVNMGQDVVVVDWIHTATLQAKFWMVVSRKGKVCQVSACTNTSPEDLAVWVDDKLSGPAVFDQTEGEGINTSIEYINENVLSTLVAPLKDVTVPGETIIFCPTRILHRLPLHAVKIDGIPLIERNRIIYAQSLSLLRLCSQSTDVSSNDLASTFTATYFNTLGSEANEAIEELRCILHGTALKRKDTTKESFIAHSAKSAVIHVHGHVDFDENDPLKHSLRLRERPKAKYKLTAEEIFDVKFFRPSIVMAMGCNSGRSRLTDYDDLLGLTAAFHYAGASAVISTLWSVMRSDCEKFSKAFYKHIRVMLERVEDQQSVTTSDNELDIDSRAKDRNDNTVENNSFGKESSTSKTDTSEHPTIDLGEAMQKAVMAVRFEADGSERNPYHWAGFTLHGWWRFPKLKLNEEVAEEPQSAAS